MLVTLSFGFEPFAWWGLGLGTKVPDTSIAIYHDSVRKSINTSEKKNIYEGLSNSTLHCRILHQFDWNPCSGGNTSPCIFSIFSRENDHHQMLIHIMLWYGNRIIRRLLCLQICCYPIMFRILM